LRAWGVDCRRERTGTAISIDFSAHFSERHDAASDQSIEALDWSASGFAVMLPPMHSDTSALQLVLTGDPALLAIVRLSLAVSLSAVVLAALIGIPLGAFIALTRFRGREAIIVLLNALMGLPPVVVGLAVYLLLSRSGPLGAWG